MKSNCLGLFILCTDMQAVSEPSEVEMMCESGARSDCCSALMGFGTATVPNP